MIQNLETESTCINSTYSMTFFIVRITEEWSNILQKSWILCCLKCLMEDAVSHRKKKKNIWKPFKVQKYSTVAFVFTRTCAIITILGISI